MRDSSSRSWSVARFPSRSSRQRFLERVRLLNRVEDQPRFETEPLPDGTRVRYSSADARHRILGRLVDCFGGRVAGLRYDPN
jgi:hypothetical protein